MKKFHFSHRQRRLLLGAALAAIAMAIFCILERLGFGIPCLFNRFTGLLCPGCGNSRAALALLRLDFAAAFRFNPLFPLEFFYLVWILFHCCRAYLKGKSFGYKPPLPILDISILILLLFWWIFRNCI